MSTFTWNPDANGLIVNSDPTDTGKVYIWLDQLFRDNGICAPVSRVVIGRNSDLQSMITMLKGKPSDALADIQQKIVHNIKAVIADVDALAPDKRQMFHNDCILLALTTHVRHGTPIPLIKAKLKTVQCMTCATPIDHPKRCSRCNMATYCSKACQVANWPTHKSWCVEREIKRADDDPQCFLVRVTQPSQTVSE